MGCAPRRWSRRALVLLIALLTVSILPHPASGQEHPTHVGIVADQPVNYTPDVLNGHVSAVVQIGDQIIAAGRFSKVEQDGRVFVRKNIVAFNALTGRVNRAFAPTIAGEVHDLQVTPDQAGVVAVGNFSGVNGAKRTAKVALIRFPDGSVDPAFASPAPNDTVRDVAYANGLYYVAGDFTRMGDHARRSVAALGPRGRDTGIVHLNFQGNNNGGQTKSQTMDVSPNGDLMVVGGNFSSVDGVDRGQVAVIDLTPTSATLTPWDSTAFTPPCGPRFDTYMRQVAIAPDASFFVVATTGGPRGRQPNGLLCDSVSRFELTPQPGQQPTWINYTGGDTLTAAIVDTNVVYLGGHMRWVNNSYGHNDPREGAVRREGIAALDPANGLPYTWNPGRRRGYGVFGFTLTEDGLWTGSDTTGFGGELRGRIAYCRIVTGEKLPRYVTGSLPGTMTLLGEGTTAQVGSMPFTGRKVGAGAAVSTTQDWRKVRGSFVVDGVLYAGWANGTMTAQSFDGASLGPAAAVNLRKGFADLADVNAMFFDRVTRRIYYTLEGSPTLYYRYFQPQSRVIGSWRYEVTAPSTVSWTGVRGGFIVGSRLFYTTANGDLHRVAWESLPGQTSGAPTAVLGPSIDGTDLRSAGVVFSD